ncbi:hypothetical protein PC129_g5727 [Phytophthora cactorum]|uniref:Uncharacterized protein n=1 Tax=Phytophthora cactorum TaxID=29920 RepID=A0A329RZ54_9STRA|nr:hypothetical protein Pcac1_g25851 [Phytophthora cactorum]KAG2813426.1 hypothetical protein PC112_g14737 [Phytophthora cactorum]KAG2818992.1 hypothetical protein PC111_g12066 [Phytophthora cactorum]KAG2852667.1 hypothetical protein PC113_g14823 [Phytophthora cactorum]KAG2913903.1 hypothetical protein PC114_g8375 [Phytophthora cactorum]
MFNLIVAVATPVPCLDIALVSDAIPLAPPENGPRGNKYVLGSVLIDHGIFYLGRVATNAPSPYFTNFRTPSFALPTVSWNFDSVHGATSQWQLSDFQCLFRMTLNIVWIPPIAVGLWGYMGPACRASANVRHRLKLHPIFIYAASSLAVVYPLFYYAFLRAREYANSQFLLTFALPVIKMMEKLRLYHTTCHAADMHPVFIAYNVEVFNALFVSSCMRNATSVGVTIALMVADFMGACAALYMYGLRNIMLQVDKLGVKMGSEATRAQMIAIAFIAKHRHPDSLVAQGGSAKPQCFNS